MTIWERFEIRLSSNGLTRIYTQKREMFDVRLTFPINTSETYIIPLIGRIYGQRVQWTSARLMVDSSIHCTCKTHVLINSIMYVTDVFILRVKCASRISLFRVYITIVRNCFSFSCSFKRFFWTTRKYSVTIRCTWSKYFLVLFIQ